MNDFDFFLIDLREPINNGPSLAVVRSIQMYTDNLVSKLKLKCELSVRSEYTHRMHGHMGFVLCARACDDLVGSFI